ncbi:tRNA lysidine(34) synthetase TilS [uncultured Sphaerochaeta sp.]|uniref:tRNA lysidine(34) synthetase TilS n=1 Tax=uncultured Sphaerochaeta sp. TaxID=886478 RepID=UPI002A0A6580|nr:tRNA lysidine(34) synthetase TilS [uncultured Sphaerochaeta sp.]
MPIIDETISNKIRLFLQEQAISPADLMVVAFSGGSDSLALLAALSFVRDKHSLLAVYVNHRLRSDSELAVEIALNETNCKKLGVPLVVVDLGYGSVKQAGFLRSSGTEEAARALRYSALTDICHEKGACYLATAHTCDDQLETILTRVFQGSPVSALGGIDPRREDLFSGISLVRPVLELSHEQLQQYLKGLGLLWSEDSTNQSDAYFRNSLRHTVSPAILSLFPQAYKALGRLNQRTKEVSLFIDGLVCEAVKKVEFAKDACIPLDSFLSLEPVVRDSLLYKMFDHISGKGSLRVSYSLIQRIRKALEASEQEASWKIFAFGTCAYLSDGVFSWQKETKTFQYCLELKNKAKSCIVELPDGLVLSVEPYDKDADPTLIRIANDKLENVIVRSPQEGDCISLQGKTVLLTKLFSEWKIPSSLQNCIPVLEDASGIVVVFGKVYGGRDRLCERYKSPLAPDSTNIYSVKKRNECREI